MKRAPILHDSFFIWLLDRAHTWRCRINGKSRQEMAGVAAGVGGLDLPQSAAPAEGGGVVKVSRETTTGNWVLIRAGSGAIM